jgi:hypothetical protein
MRYLLSLDESIRLKIWPDYSRSPSELYTQLVENHYGGGTPRKMVYFPQHLRRMLRLEENDPAVQAVEKKYSHMWETGNDSE